MDLLGGSSDSDTDDKDILNTNNDYAAKYDNWRGKEHLQKLKDKYGDRDLEEEEDDSSSEESEDEEAEELTPEVEKDFFVTLASLKTKDPSIYDGKTSFFKEKSESSKGWIYKIILNKDLEFSRWVGGLCIPFQISIL